MVYDYPPDLVDTLNKIINRVNELTDRVTKLEQKPQLYMIQENPQASKKTNGQYPDRYFTADYHF